jgi:hypothetical protein
MLAPVTTAVLDLSSRSMFKYFRSANNMPAC